MSDDGASLPPRGRPAQPGGPGGGDPRRGGRRRDGPQRPDRPGERHPPGDRRWTAGAASGGHRRVGLAGGGGTQQPQRRAGPGGVDAVRGDRPLLQRHPLDAGQQHGPDGRAGRRPDPPAGGAALSRCPGGGRHGHLLAQLPRRRRHPAGPRPGRRHLQVPHRPLYPAIRPACRPVGRAAAGAGRAVRHRAGGGLHGLVPRRGPAEEGAPGTGGRPHRRRSQRATYRGVDELPPLNPLGAVPAPSWTGTDAPTTPRPEKDRATMKLYRLKIPEIAHDVIERLCAEGTIEVSNENRAEAELDLVAIMEEYSRRDHELRERVKEYMARNSVPYDRYGKVRGQLSAEMGHPTGDDVERFLARQFVENFMISNFVDEVYAEDRDLYKRILEILRSHDVDERALREEARERIKNIAEGTVDYELALAEAMREVKKRHGLIR
ncbi:MAG: DUF507 family protein [Deltaproteobacteria bacterium]|nr:MAG: DUF507 family protein [Deltaproteobacteria bacterium]